MTTTGKSSRLPNPLTEGSPVLVSSIPLPPQPSITCVKFIPSTQQDLQHKTIELARQRIVNAVRRSGKPILESLLPIVRVGKEEVALWIFFVRSRKESLEHEVDVKGKEKERIPLIEELELDGLHRSELIYFNPSELYPCSAECAKLLNPCSSCSRMPGNSRGEMTFSSPTTFYPRLPLRPIYTFFIDAVRDRLLDDICSVPPIEGKDPSVGIPMPARKLGAIRFGRGFLSSSSFRTPNWGRGWEERSSNVTLVHTALDIYLSPLTLHIRPLPTITRLFPVPIMFSSPNPSHPTTSNPSTVGTLHSPPLVPGTPLILAPYPTPAFYVSAHASTSISSALRTQFWEALAGLGASFPPEHDRSGSFTANSFSQGSRLSSINAGAPNEPFILAYIPLHNPQGEPKGVAVLWPSHLAFVDTSPNRIHLTNLPEIPGTEALLTPPRTIGMQSPNQTSPCATFPPNRRRSSTRRRSVDHLSRAQRAFRALELSSRKRVPGVPVQGVAKSTSVYVDFVAKEREKERERINQERLRRDREMREGKATSSSSVSQIPTNNAYTDSQVSQVSRATVGSDTASPKAIAEMTRPGTSWHSVSTNYFAKVAQDSVVHSFYPSPPDWPATSTQASGAGDSSSATVMATTNASSDLNMATRSDVEIQSLSNSNQVPTNELGISNGMELGMDIDMNDMSMGINLGHSMGMLNVNMNVNLDSSGLMDGGFGSFTDAFTDDDFNFFDARPVPEPIPVVPPDIQGHLNVDEDIVDGWLSNGITDRLQDEEAVGSSAMDIMIDENQTTTGATMSEDDKELLPPPPDLIPSSPAKSPWSPGNPPTPSLELTFPPGPTSGKQLFEPICFGDRHHMADGKYRDSRGKFAFPNTLPRTSPHSDLFSNLLDGSSPEKEDGWKIRYDAVTDPRVGVVNRLRGVKRKLLGKDHASKTVDGRLRDEEWESVYDQTDDGDEVESTSSSSEEEDLDEPELDQDHGDETSSQEHSSRPTTPPPVGLPLTATLLYFQLEHTHLLPLGVPIRPSLNDLISTNDPPLALISVPTPVSPAAALGSSSERNKTLELLAQVVAKESVENGVWAQAWGSSLDDPPTAYPPLFRYDVTQNDLRQIIELMQRIAGLQIPSSFSSMFEPTTYSASIPHPPCQDSKLQLLQPPRLSIGRAGLVHHMLPSVIRFWEKEGLGPRSGPKDIVAFALFEESDEKVPLVESWLERVGRAYSTRGFGTHTPGKAGTYERGLVPLQFEAVRKTLPNLISSLPPEPQHIVIYIIAPPSHCSSLKSLALRSIIMGQRRVSRIDGQHDYDQDRVLLHFVPDHYIMDPYTYPATRHIGLEVFVNSVYDRLLRVAIRQTSRQFWELNPAFENRFQVPAFTLARSAIPQTQLEWDERPSLNVLDRHTFLHVGYRLSKCKRWLLAACIDERGEAHDLAVWGLPNQNDSPSLNVNWMVSNVWIFVKQFAQRAQTEWRIVVSKLGEIDEHEVEVWMSHLETMISTHAGPPVHVSLVCAQNDIPLPFLCPTEASQSGTISTQLDPGAVFADVSSVTYSVFFPHRTPIISPSLLSPWEYPSFVAPASDEDGEQHLTMKPSTGILPLGTTALLRIPNGVEWSTVEPLCIHLICAYKSAKSTLKKSAHEVHADITRNWHDLAVLTRERWHFVHQGLPFHLAALEVMSGVVDPKVLTPDSKEMEYLGN